MTQTVSLIFPQTDDYIVAYKPAGINTHAPDLGKKGFVELLEDHFNQKLYVIHRLDKETSGLLLIAKSSEVAKSLTQQFEKHQVKKQYLFLTDRETHPADRSIQSHITKVQNAFVNVEGEAPNSETHFSFVKKLGSFYLWRAFPKTGKPHQIRLHAQLLNMPILGDQHHGGSSWPQLCLHSESLEFNHLGLTQRVESPLPSWAEVPLSPEDAQLHFALDRRKLLYNWQSIPEQCLRLSHLENELYRIDQYGNVWFVYWYGEADPDEANLNRFAEWADRYDKKIVVRKMLNRGNDPTQNTLWNLNNSPERWHAWENQMQVELRLDTGLSPGLFLDQRENRQWLASHSAQKSVLNLFSYTSGFSVMAALSGATEVVSVDASQNFLDWSKENFKLNGLDPEKYEFWCSDVLFFLKATYRRKRKFDVIVCDPPSFGRSKEGVFSIAKQWEQLLTSCLLILNKGGLILFSTNYEQWDLDTLKKLVDKINREVPIKVTHTPSGGLDFETPDEAPLMKSIIIRKQ
ncbi:MAG: pseudouridine synthase [Bdellovibrionia bacterium]